MNICISAKQRRVFKYNFAI